VIAQPEHSDLLFLGPFFDSEQIAPKAG